MTNCDVIKLLPDSVANQIAAGEVIQRPASVVKELVENAVDAGADDITIIIKDAGRTLIQIIDNGCGMSPTDARLAFERHATSKIASAEDLYTLSTMGFRGEALASIAAVAQIDMRTMRAGDSIGTRLQIAASKVESQEACACVPGTNLMVKNLFAYLPARRKFLKRDSVELSHIVQEFERLSLVNTGINFSLIHNDVTLHRLLRGNLRERIGQLFGRQVEKQIIPVSTETSIVRISGYVGLPQYARRKGAHQYLFVNGRNMRHPYFHRAVVSCFEKLVAADVQPSYFINFEVAPERIDVNIHPQKHEIKFEDEQAIWQILVAAIKEALGKTNVTGAIDFNVEDAPEIPAFAPDAGATPGISIDAGYNPFDIGEAVSRQQYVRNDYVGGRRVSPESGWRSDRPASLEEVRSTLNMLEQTKASSVRQLGLDEIPDAESMNLNSNDTNQPGVSSYILLANKYIVTPVREGMMVIDRHRAHVRVLYDRIMDCISGGAIATQRMIFPEIITLSASQDMILSSICDRLAQLGFDLSPLGNHCWSVNGMPSALNASSPLDTVVDIIDSVSRSDEMPDSELFSAIVTSMARTGAVNVSNRITENETDMLVADLFRTSSPNYTPDGLPVVVTISLSEISRLLK